LVVEGWTNFLAGFFVGGYSKNDMVIHTEKTGMMRLVVEIEYDGKIADVFDKATWSFDGLLPERKSVQELRVHLKLFQLHVVDIHIIEEQ
nr:hypothetical protein [Tanacetum cinerariifolium]